MNGRALRARAGGCCQRQPGVLAAGGGTRTSPVPSRPLHRDGAQAGARGSHAAGSLGEAAALLPGCRRRAAAAAACSALAGALERGRGRAGGRGGVARGGARDRGRCARAAEEARACLRQVRARGTAAPRAPRHTPGTGGVDATSRVGCGTQLSRGRAGARAALATRRSLRASGC